MTAPPVVFVLVQASAAADGGISSISQVIARLGRHRPIIVTDRDTDRVDAWRKAGIETHVLPQGVSRGLARAPLQVLDSYRRYFVGLRRIIAASGARVVHANDPAAFQLALLAAKTSPGTKIALNLRDTIDPGRKAPRARYRFLFAAADHVFFLSKDMADRWSSITANAKRAFSVTYSIVDPERFAPAPAYSGDGRPVALLSGIIRPKKGQLDFLRSVAPALAADGIETWLAGDFDPSKNPYMRACAEAAAALGDSVRFLGYRTDVPALMARAAVVVVASRHEGLVRAMIEAMASARPVVSFDVCSARELLDDQSGGAGVVIKDGDFEAMSAAITGYVRDPGLALQAGERGRSAAARLFAPAEVVERHERVYEALESA